MRRHRLHALVVETVLLLLVAATGIAAAVILTLLEVV